MKAHSQDEPQKPTRTRFTEIGSKAMSITKEELDRREAEWKKARQRRTKRR